MGADQAGAADHDELLSSDIHRSSYLGIVRPRIRQHPRAVRVRAAVHERVDDRQTWCGRVVS